MIFVADLLLRLFFLNSFHATDGYTLFLVLQPDNGYGVPALFSDDLQSGGSMALRGPLPRRLAFRPLHVPLDRKATPWSPPSSRWACIRTSRAGTRSKGGYTVLALVVVGLQSDSSMPAPHPLSSVQCRPPRGRSWPSTSSILLIVDSITDG